MVIAEEPAMDKAPYNISTPFTVIPELPLRLRVAIFTFKVSFWLMVKWLEPDKPDTAEVEVTEFAIVAAWLPDSVFGTAQLQVHVASVLQLPLCAVL